MDEPTWSDNDELLRRRDELAEKWQRTGELTEDEWAVMTDERVAALRAGGTAPD